MEPELPWGLENFNAYQQELLTSQGYLLVDEKYELGRVLFEEFRRYRPLDDFVSSTVPALLVHGDHDESVSYDIACTAVQRHTDCVVHTITGSDHGFDSREREDEAIAVTVDWLTRRHSGRSLTGRASYRAGIGRRGDGDRRTLRPGHRPG